MSSFAVQVPNLATEAPSASNAQNNSSDRLNRDVNVNKESDFSRLVSKSIDKEVSRSKPAVKPERESESEKPVESDQSDVGSRADANNKSADENSALAKAAQDNVKDSKETKDSKDNKATKDNANASENDDSDADIKAYDAASEISEADLTTSVGGGLNPDVTAISDEASAVQTAGDTNLLVSSTQSIGLLALAAQLEKVTAALNAQQLAASNGNVSTLASLTTPIAPVLTDANQTVSDEVTQLVDVLGGNADAASDDALVENHKEVQLAGSVNTNGNKVDAIINAVKQATQPVLQESQTQLNITAQETIDAADLYKQLAQGEANAKAAQMFVGKTATVQIPKSNEELLANLQQVLSDRGAKENAKDKAGDILAALGQASNAQSLSLSLDAGSFSQDDFTSLTQGGNQQPLAHASLDTLRQANTMQNSDSTFSRMLQTSNHVPVADQVLVNIKQAVADGASHIKIQLKPEELGRVDVRLSVGLDGKTSMTIMADNRDTLDMLQREVRHLERSLTDLGLKPDAGGLSFHLRQQNQEQKFTRNQTGYVSAIEPEIEEPIVVATTNAYRLSVQEGVDIHV